MKMRFVQHARESIAIVVFLCITSTATVLAEQATPGYNHKIPDKIMTPANVQTSLGAMKFMDGFPTPETAALAYDNLDRMRSVETFLNGIPAASIEGMRLGMLELGADTSNKVVLMDKLMDSAPLFLTGNTDTVYCSVILDLKKDGPTVVEIPPTRDLAQSTTPSSAS
jgi:hypothetical protein